MASLSTASQALGSALLAAALLAPAPAESQSLSGTSAMSNTQNNMLSPTNLAIYTALSSTFLLANTSGDSQNPAKVKEYQAQIDRIIIDPSAENIAVLAPVYAVHALKCQKGVNPKGAIKEGPGIEKVRDAFQACLMKRANDEVTISEMTVKDPASSSWATYAKYMPECQKINGITPGVRQGVTAARAEATLECLRKQNKEDLNRIMSWAMGIGVLGPIALIAWTERKHFKVG